MSQMKIQINKAYCPANHRCPVAPRCPFGAIIQKNPRSVPYIDESKCRHCGMCTRMCPTFQTATA